MQFIPLATSVGASLMQARATRKAGDIAAGESEIEAQQEELGAIQREADRKGDLARALASQTASAGARGLVAFSGSPLAILQEDIKAEEVATERDVFGSRLAALTTRKKGQVAKSTARTSATLGLLGDVGKLAAVA